MPAICLSDNDVETAEALLEKKGYDYGYDDYDRMIVDEDALELLCDSGLDFDTHEEDEVFRIWIENENERSRAEKILESEGYDFDLDGGDRIMLDYIALQFMYDETDIDFDEV